MAILIGFLPLVILLYALNSLITLGSITFPTTFALPHSALWVSFTILALIGLMLNPPSIKVEKSVFRINFKRTIFSAFLQGLLFITIVWAFYLLFTLLHKWIFYFTYIYTDKVTDGKFSEIMKMELIES